MSNKSNINLSLEDLRKIEASDLEFGKKFFFKKIEDATKSERPLNFAKASELASAVQEINNKDRLLKFVWNFFLSGDDDGKRQYGSLRVHLPQSPMGRSYQQRYGGSGQ